MPTTSMRLFDKTNNRAVVVDLASRTAWADKNHDGEVAADEKLTGKDAEAALRAAAQVFDLFVAPVPGTHTPDGDFDVDGVASSAEIATLKAGGKVPGSRDKLKQHLDFFDDNQDGKLSIGEVFGGFRDVGFGRAGAGAKTAAVAVLFGKIRDGLKVDVDTIGAKRYANATGIYDKNGRINERNLGEFEAAFDVAGGRLSQRALLQLLNDKGAGTVSKNQFKSLFTVTERINGDDTVTKAQFRALFDGSLLWQAASLPARNGTRGIDG